MENRQNRRKLLSTQQAALALGVTDRRIRQLCAAGNIGLKIGRRDWIITVADIKKLEKTRQDTTG